MAATPILGRFPPPVSKSKNSKKIKVTVVGLAGDRVGLTSLAHARRYVKRGVAKWLEGLRIQLLAVSSSPEILDVRPFPVDLHYQDDRSVLKFWSDQRSAGGHSRAA